MTFWGCGHNADGLIEGLNPGNVPPSVSLAFPGILRVNDTVWTTGADEGIQILNFDLRDYPFAKRVAFTSYVRSSSHTNRILLQLYNQTDQRRIPHQEVASNNTFAQFIEIPDIKQSLPEHPIDIVVSIRCEKPGFEVSSRSCMLVVYNE